MSPPHQMQLNGKSKLWPSYFVVRTTGEVVPLIAVDELPRGINLVGVPRSHDLEKTIGMLNLGLQRSCGTFYEVELDDEETNETRGEQGNINRAALTAESAATSKASTQRGREIPERHPSRTPSVRTTRNSTPAPEAQLCRHWCHHGICKWGQQCRYRHVMPMSLPGLQEVGLADWPVWYRKMNPGYFVNDSTRQQAARSSRVHIRSGDVLGARAERLRVASQGVPVRERNGKISKREELDEQIIAGLRGMSKEMKTAAGEKVLSSNAMLERAAARDTKNWEDESELADGESGGEQEEAEGKGILVDV